MNAERRKVEMLNFANETHKHVVATSAAIAECEQIVKTLQLEKAEKAKRSAKKIAGGRGFKTALAAIDDDVDLKQEFFGTLQAHVPITESQVAVMRRKTTWDKVDSEQITKICTGLIDTTSAQHSTNLAYCQQVLCIFNDDDLTDAVLHACKLHVRKLPYAAALEHYYSEHVLSNPANTEVANKALLKLKSFTETARQDDPMIQTINTNTTDACLDTHRADCDYQHMLDTDYFASLLFCKAQELDSYFQSAVQEALKKIPGLDIVACPVKSISRLQENIEVLRANQVPWPRVVHVLDPIRCWITGLTVADILRAINAIFDSEDFQVVKVTNRYWTPSKAILEDLPDDVEFGPALYGYRDVVLNCTFEALGSKIIAEIRVADVLSGDFYRKTCPLMRFHNKMQSILNEKEAKQRFF